MKSKMIILSMAFVASLMITGMANAALLPFTDSYTYNTDWGPQTLSVTKFNTSLGTLNSIKVELIGNFTGGAMLTNTVGSPQTAVKLSLDGYVSISGPAVTSLLVTPSIDLVTAPIILAGGSSITYDPTTASENLFTMISSGSFGLYVGTGDVDFTAYASGFKTYSGSPNISVTSLGPTMAEAVLRVTYDYTPTTNVPEPSLMLLLGMGIGVFGLMGFRKKN
jgi:hypothetical protein